ncbi:HU domain-containing protein [Lacihabitans soyangensis]|uniref:SPOR domain-containing protein n=1 Tax=Lacihabitans soyangensis TaxID=869394 RepID=A0AAE3KUJ8_9BACT|nr:SPOR domain-containing protein [Lacihabitans soyangensis]MCP9765009.1 SPOR domain-containing protein [Lacihabitans soyangensis]
MHSIQHDIHHFIQEQDFLVLPGIGSFLADYSKPYFDKTGEIILPTRSLVFNHLIDRDVDDKLFGLLSKNLNLPIELVKSNYYKFLNHFRSSLVLNNKFEWESLGTFYKNENQEIVFYPERRPENLVEVVENPKAVVSNLVEKEFNNSYVKEEFEAEPKEFLSSKPKNYLKLLLYLVPLFIITSTLAYTIFIKPLNKKSEKKNMVEEIDSLSNLQKEILSDSDVALEDERVISKKDNERTETKKKSERSENDRQDSSRKSHIVGIGIFKVKENVDNLAAYLAENGIPARVRRFGGKYKLFVTASSEEQADEFVKKIEQLTGEKAVYENN